MTGTGNGGNDKIEPIVILLVGLLVFNTFVLIGIAKFMSSDGQTFQIIAGVMNGCLGALLMRIKPKGAPGDDMPVMPPAPSKQVTKKTEEITTTAEPPV